MRSPRDRQILSPVCAHVDMLGYFRTWTWNAVSLFAIQVSEIPTGSEQAAFGSRQEKGVNVT